MENKTRVLFQKAEDETAQEETVITLLPKVGDLKTTPNRPKKKLLILFLGLSLISALGIVVTIFLFADFTLLLRCIVSRNIGISVSTCQQPVSLDSLILVNLSEAIDTQEECKVKDCQERAFNQSNSQDMKYYVTAERTWNTAWEILHDQSGWHLDKGQNLKTGRVFSKSYRDFGRVSKLEGYVDCSPEVLFNMLVRDVETVPSWDPTLEQSEILEVLSENMDIHHLTTMPMAGGIISRRDYVNLRYWKKKDGLRVYSSSSITLPDKPPRDNIVRGHTRPGGAMFHPVADRPDRCRLEMTISTDIGGWIPQWAVDNGIAATLMNSLKNIRKRCEFLREHRPLM